MALKKTTGFAFFKSSLAVKKADSKTMVKLGE
jgi:hypothetical protein